MDALYFGLHNEPKGNTEMKHSEAHIVEKGKDGVVRHVFPEFVGNVTREYLIDFWGLNNPDVLEWSIDEWED